MYAIEKNVPLEISPRNNSSQLKPTMMQLQVGHSFLIPPEEIGEGQSYKSCLTAQASANATALRLRPKRFVTRRTREKGIRVWRTENVDLGGAE